MKTSKHVFDQANQLIKLSFDPSADPLTRALHIARATGAFRESNVVFVHNQLYKINPHNPQQSLKKIVHKAG